MTVTCREYVNTYATEVFALLDVSHRYHLPLLGIVSVMRTSMNLGSKYWSIRFFLWPFDALPFTQPCVSAEIPFRRQAVCTAGYLPGTSPPAAQRAGQEHGGKVRAAQEH